MEFTIRQGTEKDFSIIQGLNAALFHYDAPHDDALNTDWPRSREGVAYYRQKFTDPAHVAFIAEDADGNAVGYVIGCATNKFRYRKVKTGELENMFIVPQWRGKGVGKVLIHALKHWMKTKGVGRVYVSAYANNEEAVRFYRKCGFEPWEIGLELKLDTHL